MQKGLQKIKYTLAPVVTRTFAYNLQSHKLFLKGFGMSIFKVSCDLSLCESAGGVPPAKADTPPSLAVRQLDLSNQQMGLLE